MEMPSTDTNVLADLLDRFAAHPDQERRRAILSLFEATVSDARAATRGRTEPVGFVCAGREGRHAQLYPLYARSLEVGTKLYARN